MLATALLLLALLPGFALAAESDEQPLAGLPSEYGPALGAAADQLGVSADELEAASSDELESLLCSKLEESSRDELVAGAKTALASAPQPELQNLSADEQAKLEARLPSLIEELDAKYCSTASAADGASGAGGDSADGGSGGSGSGAATSDSGVPVPNRVDTGGGGAADGALVPLAFGGLFASLFGLLGVGVVRRRHT